VTHYHNEKKIYGKSSDIKTKVGNIDAAKADFISIVDIWIPWKPKTKGGCMKNEK